MPERHPQPSDDEQDPIVKEFWDKKDQDDEQEERITDLNSQQKQFKEKG